MLKFGWIGFLTGLLLLPGSGVADAPASSLSDPIAKAVVSREVLHNLRPDELRRREQAVENLADEAAFTIEALERGRPEIWANHEQALQAFSRKLQEVRELQKELYKANRAVKTTKRLDLLGKRKANEFVEVRDIQNRLDDATLVREAFAEKLKLAGQALENTDEILRHAQIARQLASEAMLRWQEARTQTEAVQQMLAVTKISAGDDDIAVVGAQRALEAALSADSRAHAANDLLAYSRFVAARTLSIPVMGSESRPTSWPTPSALPPKPAPAVSAVESAPGGSAGGGAYWDARQIFEAPLKY